MKKLLIFLLLIITLFMVTLTVYLANFGYPLIANSLNEKALQISIKPEVTLNNQEHINLNEWKLIWQDEFDSKRLNKRKWTAINLEYEKNNELQYYSPDEVFVENNLLILRSQKRDLKGYKYTSGAVHTRGKFDFLYGFVEIRARLPKGQGIFPAFWTLSDNGQKLPEIDIFEMVGHKPEEIWMVLHWETDSGEYMRDYHSYVGSDFSVNFHTYSIEWSPNKVTWYIDGVERFSTERYSPNQPQYLYINTAIGGNWPGSPDETTLFPQHLEVDYVRVYQKR